MSVFSFDSYKDLFDKSKLELLKLNGCRCHPDYDYLLFNITVSVNHLFEWFIRDNNLNEDIRLECIRKFNPYENPYVVTRDFHNLYKMLPTFPELNERQLVIRQLCNKAKHFKRTDIERQSKKNISVSGEMRCGDQLGAFHYQYYVKIANSDKRLDIVLTEILNEWELFINEIV